MARAVAIGLVAGLLLALRPVAPASAAGGEPLCTAINEADASYTVCEVDLKRAAVRLFWRDGDGKAYGYLSRIPSELPSSVAAGATAAATAPKLLFATNGGMYQTSLRPLGLYIEGGTRQVKANTSSGFGNFYLKPNGVFFIKGDEAGILETGAYLKARLAPDLATQSGPLLVIDGKIHPRFEANGSSQKLRSGVGLKDPNHVVFAISAGGVSFGAFARLFRDRLGCRDALYLDGSISGLYRPAAAAGDNLVPLGPIIGVYTLPAH